MRSLIFFALLALSIVLTNSAAVEDYNEGKKPNKFWGIWSILGQLKVSKYRKQNTKFPHPLKEVESKN